MPISGADIFTLCGRLQSEMEQTDPGRMVVKRCFDLAIPLAEALGLPIFDENGKTDRCLEKVVDAEATYLTLIMEEGWPRCHGFEQLFLGVRALFPNMPDPRVPVPSKRPAIDRMAMHTHKTTVTIRAAAKQCEEHIAKGRPQILEGDEVTLESIENVELYERLINEGYSDAALAPEGGAEAWEIFKPHLLIEGFRTSLENVISLENEIAGAELFATLDLLMEAHERTLPPPIATTPDFCSSLDEHSQLLDVLSLGDLDPPHALPDTRVAFPLGLRLDYNVPSTSRRYQHIIRSLVNSDGHGSLKREQELALRTHLFELILFKMKYHYNVEDSD